MSINSLQSVFAVPTGIDRLGFPSYRPLPGGVPNPPNAFHETQELQTVRVLNARANQDPTAARFTEYLSEKGAFGIWMDLAKQYRGAAGFVRGWTGTGLMLAAMGVTGLKTAAAKNSYGRMRPFQIDPSIQTIGKRPSNASYPSGHSSSAYAAATVLSHLWPARAQEFNWWARQTGLSRIHAGVHFPSDVKMGAVLGVKIGLAAASILR
ncbi:MAG: phosphatase PAP2 family protein [Gaiellales bacterium]